jgi:hypothetical protein
LGLGSCAATGFRICVYLLSSAVPYFRYSLLVLKYRRLELNKISIIIVYQKKAMCDFDSNAHKWLKAGAHFGAGFMRRNWISHLRLSAFIRGSLFPKQFIDAEHRRQ